MSSSLHTAQMTRRAFVAASAGAAAGLWLPRDVLEADAASRRRVPLAREGTFSAGVMSGDPGPSAITLWSRLDDQERDHVRVRLEIARDEHFRNVVMRRDVPTRRLRDHTAKIRLGGLRPDERYWYRFATRTTTSDIGRFQTAPAPDSRRPVRVGYFSCQDFTSGFYGAYRRLIDLDCDVIVCGGDYVYERTYESDGYGGVREDKTGANHDGYALGIGDYREKYRLYRSDPDLRELHRLIPLVATWDDHEVTDNYVGTQDRSGAADSGVPADEYDRARILSGWRAWHEYMPALRFGGSYRTFRRLPFGRTLELFCTDQRSYRDDQPCGGEGLAPCGESGAPRKYLGDAQLNWLRDGLADTRSAWKLVANQLMVMPYDLVTGVPIVVDSWEGYQAERNALLGHIATRGIDDVVFLTGDIHTFFAGQVRAQGRSGPDVAVEFVGGSTTSPGTSQYVENASSGALPAPAVQPVADNGLRLLISNPWFRYAETRAHGVAVVEADERELRTTYWGTHDVTTRESTLGVTRVGQFRVPRGHPVVEVAESAG